MASRGRFTGEFKAQVVLELFSWQKCAAELSREHHRSPQLLRQWKSELLERTPQIFEHERVAELERLMRRLTMQLGSTKKIVSSLLNSPHSGNDRCCRC